MIDTARRAVPLTALTVLALVTFGTGLGWGLPGRWADPFLFGGRRPWTGAEIMSLAGPWSPAADRGSDRPQYALGMSDYPMVLNATDADRAEIVRRYRLYSCQPDEMITFRALSRMRLRPFDLDPRLYQYGGLWIYPVGALLRVGSTVGLIDLRTDLAFYLDHPDAFDRFYVVARLYSAAWGLAGLFVVYGLTLELTRPRRTEAGGSAAGMSTQGTGPATVPPGSVLGAATAAGMYAVMPVVVNAAHEAKPHLAGTVLTLGAVWAAARYVRTGRGWAWPAASAGAASAMVLTGVAAWCVLPVMVLLRRDWPWRRLIFGTLIAAGVFVAANPYLPFDAAYHRDRLTSNVGNYGTFYGPSVAPATLLNAGRLLVMGASPVVAVLGLVGCVGLNRRWLLLVGPAAFVAAQFALLAADKPAEYARFALTLDVVLALIAAACIARLPVRPREGRLLAALVITATALFALPYVLNYLADARPTSTRRTVARQLAAIAGGHRTLYVTADPAPYRLPPVDLFDWRIVLLPPGRRPPGLLVRPTDTPATGVSSPISWADKPFEVVARLYPR